MFAVVPRVLQERCQLQPKDLLVVGVSGGPDSLALMRLLHQLDWKLMIAHVNHQLRRTADQEEEGVHRWAEAIGVPCISRKIDVADYARKHSLTIEEAARICRYRFLFEVAEERQAKAVLVAHTADDQVETFLMHLLRGSGGQGLSGMKVYSLPNPWSQTLPLVRPLLSVWRSQIVAYLAEIGIEPFIDESNFDLTYTRNRIRNSLLPFLETYNPAIRKLLWQTAQLLSDEEEVLRAVEDTAWQETLTFSNSELVGFNLERFRGLPQALRRRLIRRAYQTLYPGLPLLEFVQIEAIVNVFLDRKRTHRKIGGFLSCINDGNQAYLLKEGAIPPHPQYPQMTNQARLDLPNHGTLHLDDHWVLQVELVAEEPFSRMRKAVVDAFEAWLDFEVCKNGIFVRVPQPGDRFAPLAMSGHTAKLSDIFINRRIPAWLRKAYPLVCNETQILWVPGYTISHSARLTPQSCAAVHLKLFRVQEGVDDLTVEK
ncbi:MAG: tRNA lysidine(34) synthetase TilS [Anaerolineae bacterium]|jgi:tRNA(Ile)-lysidine synthase|nr:MAG: tRNA lysidine(34) synthetase TilS [Anaerolineae bacterium]